MAGAFPPYSQNILIFFAFVPLILTTWKAGLKSGFCSGFLTGCVFFLLLLWWIAPTLSNYGKLSTLTSWPVMCLLVLYLALFLGLWSGLWGWLTYKIRSEGISVLLILCIGFAGHWVCLEWIRGYLIFNGFPWGSAAYALAPLKTVIQTASIWGPYGVSFFILIINFLLAFMFLSLRLVNKKRDIFLFNTVWSVLIILIFLSNYLYGSKSIISSKKIKNSGLPVVAAALQGSFNQDVKWKEEVRNETLKRYEKLGLELVSQIKSRDEKNIPRLFIWPETAIPFYFQEKNYWHSRVLSIVHNYGATTVAGSQSYTFDKQKNLLFMNSAYIINPQGDVIGRYDKQHLVPFGEYLPLDNYIGWVRKFMPTAGNFSPGPKSSPLIDNQIKVGVLVCFESIFPEYSRQAILKGSNILAVITNDGWFGRTGAPYQHYEMAIFRAVETGRWLIRSANTGISAIISPWGEVLHKTQIYKPSFVYENVDLRNEITFLVKYGSNWFILTCLFCSLLPFFYLINQR